MRRMLPTGHRGLAPSSAHCVPGRGRVPQAVNHCALGWGGGLASALVARTVEGPPPNLGLLVQKVSHLLSSSNFGEAGDRGGPCFRDGDSHYPRGEDVPQGAAGRVRRWGWGLSRSVRPVLPGTHLQVLSTWNALRPVFPPTDRDRVPPSPSHPFLSFPFLFPLAFPGDFDLETTVGRHRPKNSLPKPEPRCCLHPGGACIHEWTQRSILGPSWRRGGSQGPGPAWPWAVLASVGQTDRPPFVWKPGRISLVLCPGIPGLPAARHGPVRKGRPL